MILAFLVLAVAVVAAGCGGDDEETSTTTEVSATAEWADGLCSAITTWKGALSSIASQFTDPSSLTEDGLQSAAADAKEATDTFVGDLNELGTPDTASGEEIKSSVDELSTTVQAEFDTLESAVGDVSSLRRRTACGDGCQGSDRRDQHRALWSTLTTIEDAETRTRATDHGSHRQLTGLRERHELRVTRA